MSTLLLRLAAPMQAWGSDSRFDTRRTGREPTKSGVIGLLAAALGRRRDESIQDLCQLRFGVRVDQEGQLLRDYHIARSKKQTYVTNRYYLCDAVFLVGLESEDGAFLERLHQALQSPVFPLFLGRRSCPPSLPVTLGVREASLLDALRQEPWLASPWMQRRHKGPQPRLRLVTDALESHGAVALQHDLPLSFHIQSRQYTYRAVQEHRPVCLSDGAAPPAQEETSHDPMVEL